MMMSGAIQLRSLPCRLVRLGHVDPRNTASVRSTTTTVFCNAHSGNESDIPKLEAFSRSRIDRRKIEPSFLQKTENELADSTRAARKRNGKATNNDVHSPSWESPNHLSAMEVTKPDHHPSGSAIDPVQKLKPHLSFESVVADFSPSTRLLLFRLLTSDFLRSSPAMSMTALGSFQLYFGRRKVNGGVDAVLKQQVRCNVAPLTQKSLSRVSVESKGSSRIGVLGASGYTGSEIVRLLTNHPEFDITLMTADRKAGQSIGSVFPHLITQDLPDMVSVKDADFSKVDAVFCCLPHGTTQEIIKNLPTGLKIVDLSADFRLQDVNEYEEWYGQPHRAPELQKEAIYGLTEVARAEIQNARLVANPGCYPTTIQIPLIPLIKDHLIESRNIIIDAKSGVSGAGRSAKEANLYTEISEGIYSYGVTKHRHVPEIEQGLSDAAHSKVTISFTPHLMPMSRGMQSTMYVEMLPGVTVDDLYQNLHCTYEGEEFIKLLDKGAVPHTQHVRGSNYCLMNVFEDRIAGRAIIISVIDNLVKGASGQALQNLNLMMGYPENMGLLYQPLFP